MGRHSTLDRTTGLKCRGLSLSLSLDLTFSSASWRSFASQGESRNDYRRERSPSNDSLWEERVNGRATPTTNLQGTFSALSSRRINWLSLLLPLRSLPTCDMVCDVGFGGKLYSRFPSRIDQKSTWPPTLSLSLSLCRMDVASPPSFFPHQACKS